MTPDPPDVSIGSFRRPDDVPDYEILESYRSRRDGAHGATLTVDTRATKEADLTLVARDIKARYADLDSVSVEFIDSKHFLDYRGGAHLQYGRRRLLSGLRLRPAQQQGLPGQRGGLKVISGQPADRCDGATRRHSRQAVRNSSCSGVRASTDMPTVWSFVRATSSSISAGSRCTRLSIEACSLARR